MKLRTNFLGPAVIAVLIMAGTSGRASDCPEFGVSAAKQEQFCADLFEILYGPVDQTDSTPPSQGSRDSKTEQGLIDSDPLWSEAYRVDPRTTLALIERIRGDGGLAN